MGRELYFLISTPPPDLAVDINRLCRMKVSKGPTADPLVAFLSEDIGRQLIIGRGLDGYCALLPSNQLTPDEMERSRTDDILLFERPKQVVDYLEQGESFDCSKLIVSPGDANRKLQSGV